METTDLVQPACDGMKELAFAQPERARLSGKVDGAGGLYGLMLATDVVQLHILHGYAVTAGSAYGHAAPKRSTCTQLFTAVHDQRDNNTQAQLHVGGRAFTKHAHRASDGWWGASTGSNAAKNAAAQAIFDRIWDNASWRNIFWLPHDMLAFEIRVKQGYGMRFQRPIRQSASNWTFRGFVEPAHPGGKGHTARWRH